jgi:lactate dehydrogenase-like 2-hydroxyacid dehydrogenase
VGALPVVFYTHWCPDDGPDLLRPHAEVVRTLADHTPSHDEIVAQASDAVALCFFVPDLINAALIARLPKLRVLAAFGKGYDNVDVPAATARGIWVTNVPGALTEATADLGWALMMGLARNVVPGDSVVRARAFGGWHPKALLGASVHGKRLGIIGFGEIGRALARRAAGFSMSVGYYDTTRAERQVEEESGATFFPFAEILRSSDFVLVVTPLTERTHGMIGAREVGMMKPHAYLINIARGSVVNEAAIAAALERRAIAGYAADVFAFEDRQYPDHPAYIDPILLAHRDRTVFTPHLGTAVLEDRRALSLSQATSVLEVLSGKPPRAAVNAPQA